MSSAAHDPLRLPARILALVGLAGLVLLTLVNRGATRMYATPWTTVLAAITALPPLLLLLRLTNSRRPVRLPSSGWSLLAGIAIALPIASAMAGWFRGPSLLVAAGPVAAACLFLLVHDWLQEDPARNRRQLENWLVLIAAAIAVTSAFGWLGDVAGLERAELLSRVLFDIRNPHPLGHSNYTAGLMLLGLPVAVLAASRARQTGTSPLLRSGSIVVAGLLLLNLFTSGSRGGLIGLGVIGVLGLALAGLGWKRFLLFTAGLVVVALLLAVAHPRIRSMLVTDPLAPPNLSSVQREAMTRAGWLMGLHRPVLGWGPGTTPLVYPRYRPSLDGGVDIALQLHSTPVQLWAETGAAGLLAALLFAGLAIRHWRNSPVAAVTLAGYGAFALTDYQLDIPVFAAGIATFAALLAAAPAPVTTAPAPARCEVELGALVLAATCLVVIFGARDPTPRLNVEALALGAQDARRAEAVARFNASLALNFHQEIAHFNLGWLLLVPDPAAAERHFRAAAHLAPDKGGVYFGLGLACLNQRHPNDAAKAFALECLNDPRFLASPWWNVPAVASLRAATATQFVALLNRCADPAFGAKLTGWQDLQVRQLQSLAPRLGSPSPGPELAYRRERTGYAVLMRNLDLPTPVDLYDVREDPRFPATVPFALPPKGWLPSTVPLRLLKLLAEPPTGPS